MSLRAGPRVLVSPYARGGPVNPYLDLMDAAMTARGAVLEDFGMRKAVSGGVDVVHVHWPERLVHWRRPWSRVAFEVAAVLTSLAGARLRGARVVWTAHNTAPHDNPRPRAYRCFSAAFVRMLDLVIVLSDASGEQLRADRRLRRVPVVTVPHGHYRDSYPPRPTRAQAQRVLGGELTSPVLLSMGLVRRYKNLPALVTAFRREGSGGTLLVAGSVGEPSLEEELRGAAGADPRVRLLLEHVPDDVVAALHGAADVVVLPYAAASVLNSGAALLGLSLGVPVVAPDTASMRELQALVGAPWLATFTGGAEEALAAARRLLAQERPAAPDLSTLEWEAVAERCLAAYASVTGPA